MNDLAQPRAANLLPSAPSMLCVRPEIASALADREFVFDGADKWNVDFARRMIAHTGLPDAAAEIERTLEAVEASLQPVPRKWLGDRLTLMWTMFMASRANVDPNALTIWLAEYLRLLGDLPHDIAAMAIDQAVLRAKHEYLPSIGEIHTIAAAALVERERQRDRLTMLVASVANG